MTPLWTCRVGERPDESAKEMMSQALAHMVAAQSGVGFQVHPAGQDYEALDAKFEFTEAALDVQLKSTWSPKFTKAGLSYKLEWDWMAKWAMRVGPVILVVLVLDKEPDDWVVYEPESLLVNGRMYWARVDTVSKSHVATGSHSTKTITLPLDQLVCTESVQQWHELILRAYAGFGGAEA